MPISNRSVSLRWSRSNGVTSRTAVYGPVRTVVWQGSAGADALPARLEAANAELYQSVRSDMDALRAKNPGYEIVAMAWPPRSSAR
jgi:hypothetical protein